MDKLIKPNHLFTRRENYLRSQITSLVVVSVVMGFIMGAAVVEVVMRIDFREAKKAAKEELSVECWDYNYSWYLEQYEE